MGRHPLFQGKFRCGKSEDNEDLAKLFAVANFLNSAAMTNADVGETGITGPSWDATVSALVDSF